jgi:formamidopyrimidine-DNA glycosylase
LLSAGAAEPAAPSALVAVDAARAVVRSRRLVPEPIAHIAPDPLEAAFDQQLFAARLALKKTQIKRALLDQSLISGIGNIYADEALWRARLHWARPTDTLKRAEVSRLLEAVREVLTEALQAGGTSFDALYVNVNGESGYFDRSLNAYGREGEPCARCGTAIRRDAFMNRSSYSCPRCQTPAQVRSVTLVPGSSANEPTGRFTPVNVP